MGAVLGEQLRVLGNPIVLLPTPTVGCWVALTSLKHQCDDDTHQHSTHKEQKGGSPSAHVPFAAPLGLLVFISWAEQLCFLLWGMWLLLSCCHLMEVLDGGAEICLSCSGSWESGWEGERRR